MGLVQPPHRKTTENFLVYCSYLKIEIANWFVFPYKQLGCPIPVANDPNKVVIPKRRSPEKIVQSLSYIMEDDIANNGSQSPLFGGHQSWQQREESFKPKSTMKVNTTLFFQTCI